MAIARVLTIAGSDSGGGAGIQADLKAIAVLGGHGMSVITALTAQNTREVRGVHPVPLAFVREQFQAVAEDIGLDGVKTGMLHSAELVELVAELLAPLAVPLAVPVVVDPVMVAKGGGRLLREDAVRAVRDRLLPVAALVTPNLDEAEALLGFPVRDPATMEKAAGAWWDWGPGRRSSRAATWPRNPATSCSTAGGRGLRRSPPGHPPHPRHRLHPGRRPGHPAGPGLGTAEGGGPGAALVRRAIAAAWPWAGATARSTPWPTWPPAWPWANARGRAGGPGPPGGGSRPGGDGAGVPQPAGLRPARGRLLRRGAGGGGTHHRAQRPPAGGGGPPARCQPHVAKIVLTAMRGTPPCGRPWRCVRRDPARRARALGLAVAEFSRAEEPGGPRAGGSSLGGAPARSSPSWAWCRCHLRPGRRGKEPVIRLLAHDPRRSRPGPALAGKENA